MIEKGWRWRMRATTMSLAAEFLIDNSRDTKGIWLCMNISQNFSMLKFTITLEGITPFLKLHVISNTKLLYKNILPFLNSKNSDSQSLYFFLSQPPPLHTPFFLFFILIFFIKIKALGLKKRLNGFKTETVCLSNGLWGKLVMHVKQ